MVRAVQSVAHTLDCGSYHSQLANKEWYFGRFLSGESRIIAATNALGLRIDIPDIRHVIYVGAPWNLFDYAQKNRRAGRNREASEAVIVREGGVSGTPAPEAFVERLLEKLSRFI